MSEMEAAGISGPSKIGMEDERARLLEVTLPKLKDELRKRKLKTTGNKNELVVRLETALSLEDQYNSESGDGESDDEDGRRNDTSQAHRERRKFVPSFKDVEESMETFSGDDGTDITQWLLNFEETAELCEW